MCQNPLNFVKLQSKVELTLFTPCHKNNNQNILEYPRGLKFDSKTDILAHTPDINPTLPPLLTRWDPASPPGKQQQHKQQQEEQPHWNILEGNIRRKKVWKDVAMKMYPSYQKNILATGKL